MSRLQKMSVDKSTKIACSAVESVEDLFPINGEGVDLSIHYI